MQLFTFSELKTKIGNDYDITDEKFVTDTELVGYLNDAIDDAETTIHTLHHEKKYFLTWDNITLVSGTALYDFPSDIYGNKIRLLMYINGSKIYKIKPIRNLEIIPYVTTSEDYRYLVKNDTTTGVQLWLTPTPAEAGAYVRIWYIRNMIRMDTSLVDTTNICEVPECVTFVTQHVRHALAKKTRRADLIQGEKQDLGVQYNLMTDALKEMTADEENHIQPDLSSYYDQEGEYYGY